MTRQNYYFAYLSLTDKKWKTLSGLPPKIIGHRGEKVLMPEHTVGSYEIACIEGADYVEPDLVLTKDFQLVCFHDLTLKASTNIEEIKALQYLKWNYTGPLGVHNVTIIDDWFIPDLTLPQIRMLTVEQKNVGIRPQYFNEMFKIATFQEYLDVVHKMSYKMNRSIGKKYYIGINNTFLAKPSGYSHSRT
jgi:glycerophosphoryl diester phosphodiesterase